MKPEMVNLDTDNKVMIEIAPPEAFDLRDEAVELLISDEDTQSSAENIVLTAEREAEQIIASARAAAMEEAAKIHQTAEAEAAALIAEARETGYNDGMATATKKGEEIKAHAQKILDDANAEREKMQASLEPEIVNMVIAITEKLLGDTVKINPAIIVSLVKQGFAGTSVTGDINIHVSANDYELIAERIDEISAVVDGSSKIQFIKDLSLSPMDCVIETPMGAIDCSLGQQFETLKANLLYILNEQG
ncbi:MAG: FliH/SctL family protein [Defluviitaleaceae bacterium]|nr:FliH/SctL family protein [Defluviitaleaceae bacterium]